MESQILMQISSVFPFDLSLDTVTINANKVSVIRKGVFNTKQISGVTIENISHVDVSTGLFAATLNLTDSSNIREPIHISAHHLRKSEALKARQLIQGLITTKRNNIPLTGSLAEQEVQAEKLGAEDGKIKYTYSVEDEGRVLHYYGDLVRVLFFIGGIMMLCALPFFYNLIVVPVNVSILVILGLVFLAGIINPKHLSIAIAESLISITFFLFFENTAMYYFIASTNVIFAILNQILAMIFFITIYYSIKTTRGFLLRKN